MIRKTSETRALAGHIANEYDNSQNSAYSSKYINDLATYSAAEQRIGTWKDGKPIYRQVLHYTFTATSSSSSFSESISSLSIDSVISTEPIVRKGTGSGLMQYSGNYYLASDNASFVFFRSNMLEFRLPVSVNTSFDIDVVLEYTKTTD